MTGIATRLALAAALAAVAGSALAQTPADYLRALEAAARKDSPGFAGFSAQRGERLFKTTHGGEWSCASCHTDNPLATGKHAKTGKSIAPLAPAANAERFTDAAKIEKWFKRNCNDVLGRACTPVEKGDVLTWLTSLKG
jgi:mono/diheme cytochrome c family protein